MSEILLGTGAAAGAGAAWWLWRAQRIKRISRERLREPLPGVESGKTYVVTLTPSLRRWLWVPWVVGALVALVVGLVLAWPAVFAVALGVIVGVMTWILEQQVAARNAMKLENQLANSIDLMVGALSAGAGTVEALDSAARESPKPIRGEIEELLGRIRYGENPQTVWADLTRRVPLETFRLFSFTMAVHGEVGGSLKPTLSQVGRSIRDRIEISRRIRAQSTEAQASVIGIVCISYFLALLMWRTNPESFEDFLKHPIGANFAAGAMVLQAIGLVWINKLAQLRF
jgi:tight adherence protein B